MLLFAGAGACTAFKPENRVRLGMSVQDVEALVGPPRRGMWTYELPDGSMTIHFDESGVYEFYRNRRDDTGETTEGWLRDETPYQSRFVRQPNGFLRKEWQHSIPPSSLPIVYQDSQTKVVKLYGQAPYMELFFAEQLFGHFKDGKLVKWFTTPLVPIVQRERQQYRVMIAAMGQRTAAD
jgi:hypothetical protein